MAKIISSSAQVLNLSNFIDIETSIKPLQKSASLQSYLAEISKYEAYFSKHVENNEI